MESVAIAPGVAGIILAGGRSRRMGRDKAFLALPGDVAQTFVERLTFLLSGHCEELIVVARPQQDDYDQFSAISDRSRVVYDEVPDQGPLMGLYSGLQAISYSHALVLAVDQPFVQPALLAWLRGFPLDDNLLMPRVQDTPQVLLARYPRALLPLISTCLQEGRRDPRALLTRAEYVRFLEEEQLRAVDPDLRSFVNINTPEDLRAATDLC